MHRGISLQMTSERSRNKERLEASLTWLCELELLKQRQESLVLGALSLGDTVPGCPAWGDLQSARSAESGPSREQEDLTLRRQLNRLQGAPNGLMVVLQEQLSELRADACDHSADDDLDSPSSSGFYEQNELQSPPRRSSSSSSLPPSSLRPSPADSYLLDWEAQRNSSPRAALSRSFSAPYPPLEGIAEGTEEEEEEEDEEDDVVNEEPRNRPEMGLTAEVGEGHSVEVEEAPVSEVDEGPTAEDIRQALRVEAYILGLLQRCSIGAPASSTTNHWQDLDLYPPSYCDPSPNQSEWQEWGGLNEGEDGGEDSQERYYMSHLETQAQPSSLGCEDPESSLEMEPYGAMEPCSSSEVNSLQHQRSYLEHHPAALDSLSSHYIHNCASPTSTPGEQDWTPQTQEQEPPRSLTRMHQEEWWSSVGEMRTKTASRSQSEGSFPPRGWIVQPEHRYHTVGRGMSDHCVDDDYLSNRRLWSSSADLSQEEEESAVGVEERALGHARPPCHTLPHACSQYADQGRRQGAGPRVTRASRGDGSDSSPSETCSPASSSASSDSDESGGLVWPQRLPPRLPPSSQSGAGAVVKVKASHALKRKILRFHSSSLKVMTTV